MSSLSIRALSKALENSPLARKAFRSGIEIILRFLEHERLIDSRQVENVAMDWGRGTFDLGDGFINTLIGRVLSQYGTARFKKGFDHKVRQKVLERHGYEDKYVPKNPATK